MASLGYHRTETGVVLSLCRMPSHRTPWGIIGPTTERAYVTEPDQGRNPLEAQAAQAAALLKARNAAKTPDEPPQPIPPTPAPRTGRQGTGAFIMANLKYILGVAAVALIAAVGIVIAAPLILQGANGDLLRESTYVSPYDWSKLDREGGRYRYIVDGEERSRIGIDVSENQHAIDWDAVAADGIDFAMVRLGYRGATAGDLYLDEYYWANLDGARNAGIDCGVYFFSQASTPAEAVEEADFVLEYLNGTPLEYPIAFDSEEKVLDLAQSRTTGLDNAAMTEIMNAFCQRIEDAGYEAIVYGNAHDLSRYNRSSLEDKEIWWAEYDAPLPSHKIDIVLWQYSNAGQVSGIDGFVDMNLDLRGVLDDPQE